VNRYKTERHTSVQKPKKRLALLDQLRTMPPMRRLTLLVPLALALVGCGDGGLYYQTRYIPTDIDSSFAVESVTWNGDREVIELPAAPPNLEGDAEPRADCEYPYQKFKPAPVVAQKKAAVASNGGGELIVPGKMSDFERPVGPTVALAGSVRQANYANSPYEKGVTPTAFPQPIGSTDTRPHSTTGVGTNVTGNPQPVDGGLNSKNYNPYCCGDGYGEGTTNQ
jgi:hypothetical protein